MNKKQFSHFVCVFLMLLFLAVGGYIYVTTFVIGSISGMNPYGILALIVSIIAATIVYFIGCKNGVFKD